MRTSVFVFLLTLLSHLLSSQTTTGNGCDNAANGPCPNPDPIPCANVNGTWTDDVFGTWTMDVDYSFSPPGSHIKGTLTAPANGACSVTVFQVTGGLTKTQGTPGVSAGTTVFNFHATNPNPPSGGGCTQALFINYNPGNVTNQGCNFGYGPWSNSFGSYGYNGTFNMTKNCDSVPGGNPPERTSDANFWGQGTKATVHAFIASINANRDFGGRTVTEQLGSSGGFDTCFFKGSAIGDSTTTNLTSGWFVGAVNYNYYGYDGVGWTTDQVKYYRSFGPVHGKPLPCKFQINQNMYLQCTSYKRYQYKTNVLTGTIDVKTVGSSRDGLAAQALTWP